MQRKHFDSLLLCWIFFGIFISYQTWFFETSIFSHSIGLGLKIVLPLLLFVFFSKTFPAGKIKYYFIFYGLLLVYVTAITLFQFDLVSMYQFCGNMYILVFFVGLVLVLQPRRISEIILKVPCYLGFFFAIQTLLLFILLLHVPLPHHVVILAGNQNFPEMSYGIFGYAGGGSSVYYSTDFHFSNYRAQSYFGEPTNLAEFMEVSFFLSLGFYRLTRSRFMKYNILLSFLTIVISFSMTAVVILFLTFFVWYSIKLSGRSLYLGIVLLPIFGFIGISVVMWYLITFTHLSNTGGVFWQSGNGFTHSGSELTIRLQMFLGSLIAFMQHPMGIGFKPLMNGQVDDILVGAVMAPLLWLIRAGVVGILIQLLIIFHTFKNYVIPYLNQKGMQKYFALAFIAYTGHQCLAGDWFDPLFFYLLAIMIAYFPRYRLLSE